MNFEDCIFNAFVGYPSAAPPKFTHILTKFLTEEDAYEQNRYKDLLIREYCTVKEFDCNIKDMKKIGEGSFGAIFLLNDKTVVKFPKSDYDSKRTPGCFKNSKDYNIADFLEEQVTNIILHCLYPSIQNVFPNYRQSVPDIFLISKMIERGTSDTGDTSDNYNIGAFMEKLFPVKLNIYTPVSEIIDIILQVANILYMLQSLYKFMHRDLHLGNIMLKKNNSPNKDIILYNGYVLKDQEFIVILIDFGNACAFISPLDQSLAENSIRICSDSSAMYGQCENCVFNKSYDLRIFMASLYLLENIELDGLLDLFFKTEIYIKHEHEHPNDTRFHSYYVQSINIDDVKFYPENLIETLIEKKNDFIKAEAKAKEDRLNTLRKKFSDKM